MASGNTVLNQNSVASPQQAANANSNARTAVLTRGVAMTQNIFSQSLTASQQAGPINVQLNRTGLITGFLVKVSATL